MQRPRQVPWPLHVLHVTANLLFCFASAFFKFTQHNFNSIPACRYGIIRLLAGGSDIVSLHGKSFLFVVGDIDGGAYRQVVCFHLCWFEVAYPCLVFAIGCKQDQR